MQNDMVVQKLVESNGVVGLVGGHRSGKTRYVLEAAKEISEKGENVAYVDLLTEMTLAETVKLCGEKVDVIRVPYTQNTNLKGFEEILEELRIKLSQKKYKAIIVDNFVPKLGVQIGNFVRKIESMAELVLVSGFDACIMGAQSNVAGVLNTFNKAERFILIGNCTNSAAYILGNERAREVYNNFSSEELRNVYVVIQGKKVKEISLKENPGLYA